MGIGLDCQFMVNGSKVVSIIPARSGSKRVPGKNKYIFQDQTLVEWSIKSSILCDEIDVTIVSTDDDDISRIIPKYNVKHHSRNKELSTDSASTFDLLKDIYFNYLERDADIILVLQPTSPLREKSLINNILNKLCSNKDWSSSLELYPVKNFTGEIKNGFWISDYLEDTRSQELPQKYVPSGRFFAFNCKNTIELNEAYGNRVVPFFTEEWKNINIDNPTDIEKMKFIYDRYTSDYSHLIE